MMGFLGGGRRASTPAPATTTLDQYAPLLTKLQREADLAAQAQLEPERSRIAAEQAVIDTEAERIGKELIVGYDRAHEEVKRARSALVLVSIKEQEAAGAVAQHCLERERQRRMSAAQLRELADPKIAVFVDALDVMLAEALRVDPMTQIENRRAHREDGEEYEKPVLIRSTGPALARRAEAIRTAQRHAARLAETADVDVSATLHALRESIPPMPGVKDMTTTYEEGRNNA